MDLSGDSTAKNKIAPYRAIFANATDGIAIIDRDAKYIEQNLAHRAILGYWTKSYSAGRLPFMPAKRNLRRSPKS